MHYQQSTIITVAGTSWNLHNENGYELSNLHAMQHFWNQFESRCCCCFTYPWWCLVCLKMSLFRSIHFQYYKSMCYGVVPGCAHKNIYLFEINPHWSCNIETLFYGTDVNVLIYSFARFSEFKFLNIFWTSLKVLKNERTTQTVMDSYQKNRCPRLFLTKKLSFYYILRTDFIKCSHKRYQ